MRASYRAVLLDSNLLLLLAVGTFDPTLIGRKRLDLYTVDDFDLLAAAVRQYSKVFTTPHLLAELSNLADQCVPKQLHSVFRSFFAKLVEELDEQWMPAAELCRSNAFARLELADAAIVQLADQRASVLSADAELCSHRW